MGFEDFDREWKVIESNTAECTADPPSRVTFTKPVNGELTVYCDGRTPYGEGTARYDEKSNTIVVGDYVIHLQIELKPRKPGPAAGSWTAEDYVPGSEPEPAGE